MPPKAIKRQLLCPIEFTSSSSLNARDGLLVIPRNHMVTIPEFMEFWNIRVLGCILLAHPLFSVGLFLFHVILCKRPFKGVFFSSPSAFTGLFLFMSSYVKGLLRVYSLAHPLFSVGLFLFMSSYVKGLLRVYSLAHTLFSVGLYLFCIFFMSSYVKGLLSKGVFFSSPSVFSRLVSFSCHLI